MLYPGAVQYVLISFYAYNAKEHCHPFVECSALYSLDGYLLGPNSLSESSSSRRFRRSSLSIFCFKPYPA